MRGFGVLQEVQKRGWSHRSLFCLLRNVVTCRGVVDKAFADPVVHKLMTEKYMLDVFGGSGVAKGTSHLDLRGYVFTSTTTQFAHFQSYFR